MKKSHWQKKTILQFHPSVFNDAVLGDRGQRGPQKQNYNTLEGRLGVYCPQAINISQGR